MATFLWLIDVSTLAARQTRDAKPYSLLQSFIKPQRLCRSTRPACPAYREPTPALPCLAQGLQVVEMHLDHRRGLGRMRLQRRRAAILGIGGEQGEGLLVSNSLLADVAVVESAAGDLLKAVDVLNVLGDHLPRHCDAVLLGRRLEAGVEAL